MNCSKTTGEHSDLVQAQQHIALIQNTKDDPLAAGNRYGTDAEIDFTPSHPQFDPSVLREAVLGNIEF